MECNTGTPDTSNHHSGHIYNNVRFFKIFTAVSAVVLSAVCAVLFALFFDRSEMYFTRLSAGYVLLATALLVCVLTAVLSATSKEQCRPSTRRASVWLGFFAGLEAVHLAVFFAFKAKSVPLTLLTLLAIIFFIGVFSKNITARTILGIATVVWCVAIIANTYFSNDIPINSPFKLLFQTATAVSMLLITSELRFMLGTGKQKMYKFFASVSFCLNLAAAASGIVLSFGDLAADISLYAFSSCALTLYSARFFMTHGGQEHINDGEYTNAQAPNPMTEQENNTESEKEGAQTDENSN